MIASVRRRLGPHTCVSSASWSSPTMGPHRHPPTDTQWTVEYDTVRRQKLFRHPPRDRTAYPALQAAVSPHIESFNALLEENGLLEHALRDIGTKVFLDGEPGDARRNRLSVRLKEVFVEKARIPSTNKFSTRNREIFPAECRERHATYRGRMRVKLEYRVNEAEWTETVRELGQLPIMLKVSPRFGPTPLAPTISGRC